MVPSCRASLKSHYRAVGYCQIVHATTALLGLWCHLGHFVVHRYHSWEGLLLPFLETFKMPSDTMKDSLREEAFRLDLAWGLWAHV